MSSNSGAGRISSGAVHYPWHMLIGVFIKKIVKYVFIAVLLAMLTYGTLAASISRFIYIYDVGYVYTQTPTSDSLKPHTQVVFDTAKTTNDDSDADGFLGRLSLAVLPPSTVAVGTVAAGPYGRMNHTDSGYLAVGDKRIPVRDNAFPSDKHYLNNEYIMKCQTGACRRGSYLIVAQSGVDGIVLHHKEQ